MTSKILFVRYIPLVIVENIKSGELYDKVVKVLSIEEIADDFNVTVEYIKQILPISDPKTSLG